MLILVIANAGKHWNEKNHKKKFILLNCGRAIMHPSLCFSDWKIMYFIMHMLEVRQCAHSKPA